MLTRTTYTAIRTLICLAQQPGKPLHPVELARTLQASPTYLAKILGQLGRAGLVRSLRGPHGGVLLARPAESIDLLMIVRTTQGYIFAPLLDFSKDESPLADAMLTIRNAGIEALRQWNLAMLVANPAQFPSSLYEDFPGLRPGVIN